MRLGIFGGTFNPIHYGHLRAAEESRIQNKLDKILFIPAGTPPLKEHDLADPFKRYEMTKIAISSNPYFVISDIEIRSSERSYTVNTLDHLNKLYKLDELFLILGIDAFLDIESWFQPEKIIENIDFIVLSREGYSFLDIFRSNYIKNVNLYKSLYSHTNELNIKTQLEFKLISGRRLIFTPITPIGISATKIRCLIRKSYSIKYLVPEEVEKFIYLNSLYIT
ncbi:MAG: nicotinate-nucleotide adenylyltransferase [Thermodesulfovibrionales bacterium]|nr:nicotinate-nucleotide adenylyltransferase [Thermodesulfovibrionales bacterium]